MQHRDSTASSIAEQISDQIRDGRLPVGSRLPSERDLAARLDCGRVMVRHAIAALQQRGIIRHLGGYRRVIQQLPAGRPARSAGPDANTIILASSLTVREGRSAPGWSDFIAKGCADVLRESGRSVAGIDPAHMDEEHLARLAARPPMIALVPEARPGLYAPGSDEWLARTCGRLAGLGTVVAAFHGQHLPGATDHVLSDHAKGWDLLTRHLVARGHRRILPVVPGKELPWAQSRLDGYRRACLDLGLEPLDPVRLEGDEALARGRTLEHALARGRLAAGNLLQRAAAADAILAPSDGWASAIVHAMRLMGLGRIAVAGYDNQWSEHPDAAHLQALPVATIDKRNEELGRQLAGLALSRLDNRDAPVRTVLIEPRLVTIPS